MDLSERKKSEVDQAAAFLADSLPPLWRRMYENCVAEGFDEGQALSLVRAYIVGSHDGPRLEK